VGSYDRSRELVIDPVLLYSSYLAAPRSNRRSTHGDERRGQIYVTESPTHSIIRRLQA